MTQVLRVKYEIDRAAGLLALILLSPIMILAYVLIAAEAVIRKEPFQVIFAEQRLSASRRFSMFKFRIVPTALLRRKFADNPLKSVRLVEREISNLTRVGRLLRRYHVDQLPQLLNLVKGDICLVGPRPYSVDEWAIDPRIRIPARCKLKGGFVGPYQSARGAAVGGTSANDTDTEYFEFATRAPLVGLLARDSSILWQAFRTLVAGPGKFSVR